MSKTPPPIAVKDVVHKIQLCLLDGIESETQLYLAGSVLLKSDYNDVVTERSIAQMCGYPLCPNSSPSNPNKADKGGRYHISLKEHKVYDLLETRMYCSTKCTVDNRTYAESLQDERSMDLDMAKVNKVYDAFSLKTAGDSLGGMILDWVSCQSKKRRTQMLYLWRNGLALQMQSKVMFQSTFPSSRADMEELMDKRMEKVWEDGKYP